MATQTIYTGKDTYAEQLNPGENHGTELNMHIKTHATDSKYGYVGFNITSAPINSKVTNVLFYYYHQSYSYTPTGYFRRVTSAWTETGLTWSNKPSVTDTNMATATFASLYSWGSVDITDLYKDAKTAGNELGIQITQNTSNDIILAPRETIYDPYIIITYSSIYYVKVGGNDTLDGESWSNAWATINKAATTVPDGTTVHIGFGDYILEPAANKIAPQNVGALGIEYLPETATAGGGTGTVSVEQNT